MGGKKTGFVFSQADGNFYGIIAGGDKDSIEPNNAPPTNNAVLVKFNPKTDKAEVVSIIPDLLPIGASIPFSHFVLKPVISEDGKSLIAIAISGGRNLPATPAGGSKDTSGGLVHINIDIGSPDYGKANIVYEFFDYSNAASKTWSDRILTIQTEPLYYNDGIASIFLGTNPDLTGTNECSGSSCKTLGKLFSVIPTDSNDWSQPWSIRGEVATFEGDRLGRKPFFDVYQDKLRVVYESDGVRITSSQAEITPNGFATELQSHIVDASINGTYHPQGIYEVVNGYPRVLSAGSISALQEEYRSPAIFTLYPHKDPDIYQRFQGYGSISTKPYSQAAHLTSTPWSSTIWITATPYADAYSFERSLTYLKQTNLYGSEVFEKDLQTLMNESDVKASTVDAIGTRSYTRYTLLRGNARLGEFYAGSIGVGGIEDEPINDRYIVTYATGGGKNGRGALIKYDQLEGSKTYIDFGNTTAGYPVGKSIQSNELILGGTSEVSQAGVKPLESSNGVWIANLSQQTVKNYRLPGVNVPGVGGDVYAESIVPPYSFVKSSSGDIWTTSQYFAYDIGAFIYPPNYADFRTALIKINGNTGRVEGGPIFLSDTATYLTHSTPLSGHGDFAMFFEGARYTDHTNTGQNLYVLDLGSNDPLAGIPNSTELSFSPDGGDTGGLHGSSFSPVYHEASDAWYVITTKNASTDEINIIKVDTGENFTTDTTATSLPIIWPIVKVNRVTTSMFSASDGFIYFGSDDGRLLRFDVNTNIVTESHDFALADRHTELRGFLNEKHSKIIGVLIDSKSEVRESGTRIFSYDMLDGNVSIVEASNKVSSSDPYPGINLVIK